MSKPFVVNQAGFRILVDSKDKSIQPGEVVTYKLSPEEIEARYGNVKGSGKKIVPLACPEQIKEIRRKEKGEDEDMKIREEIKNRMDEGKDINSIVDELIKGGMDPRVVSRFAVEFGFKSEKQKLKEQKQIKEMQQDKAPHEVAKAPVQEEMQEEYKIISVPSKNIPKRKGLKPIGLVSQDTNFEYLLSADCLIVTDNEKQIFVPWGNLDIFIEELQELMKVGGQDA